VQAAFDLPYSHRAGTEECKACHDQHNAEPGLHVEGSENLADMIGGVNKGMGFNYQYDICFQCHDTPIAKTNMNSENSMDTTYGGGTVYNTYWSTIPDIQGQFNTSNYAYHPLFAAGRNQPLDSANSAAWSSSAAKDDAGPDGQADGLDNNFVDGWKSTSLVTCSDCHGNGTASGARGIHGSEFEWVNRRMDTTVQVTTNGGVRFPNDDAPSSPDPIAANFCVNCHRADIYGYGSARNGVEPSDDAGTTEVLSRVSHRGGWGSESCQRSDDESGKGGFRKFGCLNCHGGGEVAGIHGTNLGVGTSGSSEQGKRFMNGNSKPGHTLGDVSGNFTCYGGTSPAIGQDLSSCSQHGSGTNKTPNYYYPWE
jgi:hypothetical protein